jgi:CubicO group peptidase (beta-lactamase class C family)
MAALALITGSATALASQPRTVTSSVASQETQKWKAGSSEQDLYSVEAPITALTSSGAHQGPIDREELEAFLADFFGARMAALEVPGAAFVLVKDSEIFLIKGYGYADLERQIPVDPLTTIFRIGSTSKLFTATAVMQLVEEGKIDLHTDVNRYLERFEIPDTYPAPVTMAHLLTHTGGFNERGIGAFTRTPSEIQPLGEYLAEYMPDRVMPPGEVTSYSNHGLALAGYLVETVSGIPFEQYVAERILQPLGMERSTFAQPIPSTLAASLAVPYPRDLEPGPMIYTSIAPAGMLSTTAQDMARFLIAHLQGGRYGDARLLNEETVRLMHQRHFANHPEIPGWAYGFTERTENGQLVLDHGGADPTGYGSMAVLLPEQNLGFFAVTNTSFRDELLMELPEILLDLYFSDEGQPPEDPPALPGFDQRVARVSGTYLTNRHDRHSIAKLSLLSQPPVQVRPAEESVGALLVSGLSSANADEPSRWVEIEPLLFQRESSEERIAFREAENGRITHLFARGHTPGAFDKAAWYQNPGFHQVLLGTCMLIFLTVVIGWPLAALIRRLVDHPALFAPAVRQARWLAFAVSALNPLFLVLMVALTNIHPIQFGVAPSVKVLFVIPLLTTGMTICLPLLGLRAWTKSWSTLGRAHYALVTLAAFAFTWFLYYWNLLGFRF